MWCMASHDHEFMIKGLNVVQCKGSHHLIWRLVTKMVKIGIIKPVPVIHGGMAPDD